MRKIVSSPPFILEGSTIFAALSKQFDDLRDGGGKESKTNCEEENLKKGDLLTTRNSIRQSCLKCTAKGGHAVDVSVANGGHGHHQKVDTIPVSEDLPVVKVWRVTRVFQKVN